MSPSPPKSPRSPSEVTHQGSGTPPSLPPQSTDREHARDFPAEDAPVASEQSSASTDQEHADDPPAKDVSVAPEQSSSATGGDARTPSESHADVADSDDLMDITEDPEIVDLTDDAPYYGVRLVPDGPAVKPEPDEPLPPTAVPKDQNDIEVDDPLEDADPLPELPELPSGDDFLQFDQEDRAEETENTMAMIEEAAQSFRNSLPMNMTHAKESSLGDIEMGALYTLDSDAEDAEAVATFADSKKLFTKKKKAGKLEVADQIEWDMAVQAEDERKRRRARNNARPVSAQPDDESIFFSDSGRRSPTPTEAMDEGLAAIMRDFTPDPKPEKPASTKNTKRGRGKAPANAKGGILKAKASRAKPISKKGQKPSTMDFDSLFSNDLIAIAQENQKKENQPTFTSTTKSKALSELISSMPKEQQKLHSVDKRALLLATKKFNGQGAMKADPDSGGWKLKGMKSSLHHYQLLGAAFMRDLEDRTQKPYGGFVADDMGLGKTVMAIANILDGRPNPKSKASATLVVAPSSLLNQWMSEIHKHAEPSMIGQVLLYRTGASYVVNDVEAGLSKMGVVVTSYHEVLRSWPKNAPPLSLMTDRAKAEWWANECATNLGVLHRVTWRRVILDEAQTIKNHTSRTSEAVCQLKGKYRWAISGTPIQNRLEEFYSFFRFLDLPHTGSYDTFRKNFCKRDSTLALQRLRQYLDTFMLRRTHADQMFGRPILKLPDITSKTIAVEFNTIEKTIYKIVKERFVQKIRAFVRAGSVEKKYQNIFVLLLRLRQLTAHCLLVQNALKDILEESDLQRLWTLTEDETDQENQQMIQGLKFTLGNVTADTAQVPEDAPTSGRIAYRFRKYLQSLRDDGRWAEITDKTLCVACKDHPVSPHITSCNHIYCYECLNQLSWNAAMDKDKGGSRCIECGVHFDRAEPCSREDLMSPERGSPVSVRSGIRKGAAANADESTDWFTIGGPILQSAKTKAAVQQIEQWRQEDLDMKRTGSKIIVFTQFRGMIKVMQRICQERNWGYALFYGEMSFDARNKAIQSFTDDDNCFVLLAALKAGGVGLNLTAASRVIIIDLWWNQFVETQAFCRVYRIGQGREVEVVRFVVKNTVDEDIIAMQERKNEEIDAAVDSRRMPGRLSAKELLHLFAPDLERDADGDPIAGPNEEPFIMTEDPYHKEQEVGYLSD